MNDISDLASLNFEDLAQADLFDLVTSSTNTHLKPSEAEDETEDMSRSPSPDVFVQEQSYTHITLINGEQICLRDESHSDTDWSDATVSGSGPEPDSMDLNSILQAGVVERVSTTVSDIDMLDDLDWDPEDVTSSRCHQTVIKPRQPHTILASQLPLPVPARLHRASSGTVNTVVLSSNLVTDSSQHNNNNSLLRSALIGKQSSTLLSSVSSAGDNQHTKAVLATVKTEGGQGGGSHVDDILLLSMEGKDAVARLKDGASQLFPNTRVSSDKQADRPAGAAQAVMPGVISIEVDVSGNLVLHKQTSTDQSPDTGLNSHNKLSQLAKSRKYHRRTKEEPKKESRLLHYCHICNKGFKDKYSVNVHVRTHTGEKPFSCQLCGKCFRQKAHLAKHQQTHASKQGGGTGDNHQSSNILQISSDMDSRRF